MERMTQQGVIYFKEHKALIYSLYDIGTCRRDRKRTISHNTYSRYNNSYFHIILPSLKKLNNYSEFQNSDSSFNNYSESETVTVHLGPLLKL